MLLKPVSFIKGEGDTHDLVPFGSELVETGLLFFYVERATSPPSNLGCTQELKEMSALFDDLHLTIFFFLLLSTISSSEGRFGYQEAKVYLLVPNMSFTSVTQFDLSMIKYLLKEQLVKAVTCYLFLCFSSSMSRWSHGPFLGCEMLPT